MRLSRLELENFRGFERLVLEFEQRLTVLVGENGSGKSSVLDALVEDSFGANLRRGSSSGCVSLHFTESDGRSLVCKTTGHAQGGSRSGRSVAEHPELIAFDSTRSAGVFAASQRAPEPRYGTESGARPTFASFVNWFYDHENYENQERARGNGYRDPELEAVRQAIGTVLPGVTSLRFDRARPGERDHPALVVTKDETTLSLAQLSDGERSLLSLFAEIARRAAGVSSDAPLQASLVVLIDEIDAHLHPRWQVQVVPRLLETFPNAHACHHSTRIGLSMGSMTNR